MSDAEDVTLLRYAYGGDGLDLLFEVGRERFWLAYNVDQPEASYLIADVPSDTRDSDSPRRRQLLEIGVRAHAFIQLTGGIKGFEI